jgi:hypothetical protein
MLGTGYDRAFQAGFGRFPLGLRHYRQIFKLIEYKLLVSGTAKKAAELLDEIIHLFGLPNSIITDLRSTFTGNDF